MSKKGSVFLIMFLLLGLTACGQEKTGKEGDATPQPVKVEEADSGYKEETVKYPEGQVFYGAYNSEGIPDVFMFDQEKYTDEHAAFKEYLYQDGMWVSQDMDAVNSVFEKEKVSVVSALDRAPDGTMYAIGTDRLWKIADKKLKRCKNVLKQGELQAFGYQFLGDDKIIVLYEDGSVYLKNLTDGTTVKEYGDDFTTMEVVGDQIYAMNRNHDTIMEIDVDSGEKGAAYSYDLTNQGIAFCVDDEENVYACTENGIYKLEGEGEMTEVVKGDSMTTGALSASARIDGVRTVDGVFYVTYLIQEDNKREYRMVAYSKK